MSTLLSWNIEIGYFRINPNPLFFFSISRLARDGRTLVVHLGLNKLLVCIFTSSFAGSPRSHFAAVTLDTPCPALGQILFFERDRGQTRSPPDTRVLGASWCARAETDQGPTEEPYLPTGGS